MRKLDHEVNNPGGRSTSDLSQAASAPGAVRGRGDERSAHINDNNEDILKHPLVINELTINSTWTTNIAII